MLNELTSPALSVTGVLLQGLVIARLVETSPDAAMIMTKLERLQKYQHHQYASAMIQQSVVVQVVLCVVLYCNTYRNTTCKTPDQTPVGTPIIPIDAFRAFILDRLLVE